MSGCPAPFAAPRLKARWGRKRISELADFLKAYYDGRPYEIRRESDSFVVERSGPMPEEIPLTLGDAVHNLRASLDLLASDLVRLNGQSPKDVYFPFAKDADGLQQQIKSKKFFRAGADAVRAIEQLAPHWNGNAYLRGLHELDVMDKHQLIIPLLDHSRWHGVKLEGPSGVLEAQVSVPGDGFRISAEPGDTLTLADFELVATFGDVAPVPFRGKPVVETLESLADLTAGVIDIFASPSGGSHLHASSPAPTGNDMPGAPQPGK